MVLIFAGLGFSLSVFAKDLEIAWPTFLGISITNTSTIADAVNYLFNMGVALGGIAAFLSIGWAGFQYLISPLSPSAQREAKDRIFSAIWGIVILLSSFLILQTINPDLTIVDMQSFTEIAQDAPASPVLDTSFEGSGMALFLNLNWVEPYFEVAKGTLAIDNIPEWLKAGNAKTRSVWLGDEVPHGVVCDYDVVDIKSGTDTGSAAEPLPSVPIDVYSIRDCQSIRINRADITAYTFEEVRTAIASPSLTPGKCLGVTFYDDAHSWEPYEGGDGFFVLFKPNRDKLLKIPNMDLAAKWEEHLNNQTSAISMEGSCRVTVYEHERYGGNFLVLDSSTGEDFVRFPAGTFWNDEIGSAIVEQILP